MTVLHPCFRLAICLTLLAALPACDTRGFDVGAIQRSPNSGLTALALSAGTLTPQFDVATTNYQASVSNSVTSITVTPTAAENGATITVNGFTVASGQASQDIGLQVGVNTITIVATGADGFTTKTYTVAVTRTAT